jgi:hypothetical protein
MKRRVQVILSRLPLLLLAAVVVMWVRSYFRHDTYAWYSDYPARKHWHVESSLGGLDLCCSQGYPTDMLQGYRGRPVSDWEREGLLGDVFNYNGRRIARGVAGFWRAHMPRGPTRTAETRFWGLPYWFLFALTAPAPLVMAVRRRRRRRRREKGQCLACGYDLRATPERCPECGAFAKEAAA